MKIGLDARLYGTISGGIGRYLQQLIVNLENIDHQNQYIIFIGKKNYDEYEPKNKNFQKVLADIPWYSLAEQRLMPRLIAEHQTDLMHFPHFNAPYFYQGNFVVTIHDLILMNFSSERATTLGPLKFKAKYLGYRAVINKAAKNARKIITPSAFTKSEILAKFNIEPKKIAVIYEGLTPLLSRADEIDDKKVLLRYNITKPYFFYVGNAYPHKNLEGLILVFKKFLEKHDYQLVLAGKKDYFYHRLAEQVQRENLSPHVILTDFVPDKELSALYSKAFAYIFPSLYEGFGLPPLEAMAAGVPVVSSGIPCLKEVLGGAPLYFKANNQEDCLKKMLDLAGDQELRDELIKRGAEQVKKYSWEKMARETLGIYEQCL